jgi:hypothetical protein
MADHAPQENGFDLSQQRDLTGNSSVYIIPIKFRGVAIHIRR